MALFTVASKHFVKTAGSSSLHSVPDLNSAERFKVLCLVYRKTSFWPWKKEKVKPTMVTLNDVLEKVRWAKPFFDFNCSRFKAKCTSGGNTWLEKQVAWDKYPLSGCVVVNF